MAQFDPPDSHWAADFDQRLMASFHHLMDRIVALEGEVQALRQRDSERDASLAQAVADMKFYAKGN